MESVRVPVPFFANPPEPLIMPAKVAAELWLAVRVWPEAMLMSPPLAPPPLRLPMISLCATWRMAPAAFVRATEPLSEIADPLETVKFPALIVVVPV